MTSSNTTDLYPFPTLICWEHSPSISDTNTILFNISWKFNQIPFLLKLKHCVFQLPSSYYSWIYIFVLCCRFLLYTFCCNWSNDITCFLKNTSFFSVTLSVSYNAKSLPKSHCGQIGFPLQWNFYISYLKKMC